MGRADKLMEDLEEIEDSLLKPGQSLLNLNEISNLIQESCGPDVARDFQEFSIDASFIPKHKAELVGFLKGREDLLSKSLYAELVK